MQIEYNSILRKANICLRNKFLPKQDAFSLSEVIGAVTGVPKEIVFDQMMHERTKMDAELEKHRKEKQGSLA